MRQELVEMADTCVPSLNSIVQETIPVEWKNDFDESVNIVFEPYMELVETPGGGWVYDEDNKIEFTDQEKMLIKEAVHRAVYTMDRIDSYFEMPLPWTESDSFFEWFKKSTNTIEFIPNPNQSGGAAVIDTKTIYLDGYTILEQVENGAFEAFSYQYPELIEKKGIVHLISIITHEVRHLDDIHHSTCRGSNNMDENLRLMGAHGVNILLRHWLAHALPDAMAAKAIENHGDRLEYTVFINRMCSLDTSTGELEDEDKEWVVDVSGSPLDYDTDIMWTEEF